MKIVIDWWVFEREREDWGGSKKLKRFVREELLLFQGFLGDLIWTG
uniref:Uncharacterized protein n=1 Tax=Nelumbo nucifera TaxID=4432 RepID=A0A822XX65_NELNU|nr:TPA_asm: hypothetical protein HUJ06_025069 [Nelumbo nucifera]